MPAIRICWDNTRANGQLKTVQGFLKLRFCGFGVEWQVFADNGDAGAEFIEAAELDHGFFAEGRVLLERARVGAVSDSESHISR